MLIDADPQPSHSRYYDIEQTANTSLLTTNVQQVLARISVKKFEIIISSDPLGLLENRLLHTPNGPFRMAAAFNRIQGYDVALIDTRDAIGTLVESVVFVADLYLSPVPPEIMADEEPVRGTQ